MQIDQIAGIISGILGLAIAACAIRIYLRARASLKWPSTIGQIIRSEIIEASAGRMNRKVYEAQIEYTYCVNGKFYENEIVSAFQYNSSNRNRIENILSKYPNGKQVEVYHKPNTPKVTTLEIGVQRPSKFALMLVFSITLLGIGLLSLNNILNP